MNKTLPLALAALLLPGLALAKKDSGMRVEVRVEKSGDASAGGIIRFGEDVIVKSREEIDGPIVAFGGSAAIHGNVNGPVVSFGGSVHLGPKSSVNGPVVAFGGKVTRADGSRINGPIVETPGAALAGKLAGIAVYLGTAGAGLYLLAKSVHAAGSIVLVIVLAALFPKALARTKDKLERSPVENALVGFIAWPTLGVISVTLLISVVGIPLLPLLAALAAAAYVWGFCAVGYWVGEKISMRRWKNNIISVAVGMLVLKALQWVPIVSWVVVAAAACLGTGAAILSGFGTRKT